MPFAQGTQEAGPFEARFRRRPFVNHFVGFIKFSLIDEDGRLRNSLPRFRLMAQFRLVGTRLFRFFRQAKLFLFSRNRPLAGLAFFKKQPGRSPGPRRSARR